MDDLELTDFFREVDEDALTELGLDQPWVSELFNSIDDKLCTDDLLTDVMSKNITKAEAIDSDIFEFVNDMIVGDEVEVKNSPDCPTINLSVPRFKQESSDNQESILQPHSSDTSSENFRLSPDLVSTESSSSIMSDSGIGSAEMTPSPAKKLKRSPSHELLFPEITTKRLLPGKNSVEPKYDPISSTPGRVHYVLQKGRTLFVQTDTIASINSQTKCKISPDGEFLRVKSFAQRGNQVSQVYPPTPPGSQTSSDTDTGDSPIQTMESRPHNATSTGHLNMLTRFNNQSIRIHPSVCAGRYTGSNPFLQKQVDESSDCFGVDGDFINGPAVNYSNSYSSSNPSYRQTPLFQSTKIAQSGLLLLTEEEKRTLIAEGYPVPTRLPLTKQEERNLKKIRRKIKNKISAQESRRKKKEYVETLERRVEGYSQENSELKRRIDGLEGTNRSLLSQLRHLQQLVNKSSNNNNSVVSNSGCGSSNISNKRSASGTPAFSSSSSSDIYVGNNSRAGSTSACLMVFLLCFAALFAGKPPTDPGSRDKGSLSFYSPPSGHILGDLSKLGSLNQIGYTWSGKKVRDADNPGLGFKSRSRFIGRHRLRHSVLMRRDTNAAFEISPSKPAPRSRLLGSAKEFEEECEPLSWWEYIFGGSLSSSDKRIPVAVTKGSSSSASSTGRFMIQLASLRAANQSRINVMTTELPLLSSFRMLQAVEQLSNISSGLKAAPIASSIRSA